MIQDLIAAGHAAERAGRWREALEHYEAAFGRLVAEGHAAEAADLLRWIGAVHREQGELELAQEAYAASIAIAQANGLDAQRVAAAQSLGTVERLRGGSDAVDPVDCRAAPLAREIGAERVAVLLRQNIGAAATLRGQFISAIARQRTAVELYHRLKDHAAAIHALSKLGRAHIELAEWEDAEIAFDQAAALADHIDETTLAGVVQLDRAELFLRRQRYEQARECCERATAAFAAARAKPWLAEAYRQYGVLHRETGNAQLADIYFAQAVGLAQAAQDAWREAATLTDWALLHLEQGKHRDALLCLNRAYRGFQDQRAGRDEFDIERCLETVRKAYLPAAKAWGTETIEVRDRYTAGHCQRVADYSCLLAEALGFTGWDLTWMRVGAFVHDVGKTAVPSQILAKPGALTPEERELLQSHTVVGDALVAALDFPWDMRPIVRSHHEHWDGSGYPDGLKGEQIPLPARILCVADAFDAMTTARRYRPAIERHQVMDIMQAEAGRVLDPELVATFRRLIELREAQPPASVDS